MESEQTNTRLALGTPNLTVFWHLCISSGAIMSVCLLLLEFLISLDIFHIINHNLGLYDFYSTSCGYCYQDYSGEISFDLGHIIGCKSIDNHSSGCL